MELIVLESQDKLRTALGNGRSLAVKPEQRESARKNLENLMNSYKSKIEEVSANPVSEEMVTPSVEPSFDVPAMDTPVPSQEVVEPAIHDIESSQASLEPEIAPVVEPVSEPVLETPVILSAEPVSTGVEIVSEVKETEFDKLSQELAAIDLECDQEISMINERRRSKKEEVLQKHKSTMEESYKKAKEVMENASNHLKNAQSAEQVAMIAQQNAFAMQTPEVPSVEPVVQPDINVQAPPSFPGVMESSVAPTIPSVEESVLQRIA